MSETFGFMPRRGSDGEHHPWASRDYDDVDCKATGCMFNKAEKCMVPSLCKINSEGRCEGFKAPPNKTKVDGD